jgi:RNA polymerase sigma-70 factor, ECF subfamily
MMLSLSHPRTTTRFDQQCSELTAADTVLVERAQAGDMDAFNLLVERYQQRVYGLCFRMLGAADADDATQEVFISAFWSIRRYRGDTFLSWLLRIASNKCLDYLRARKRRRFVSLDADDADTTPVQVVDPGERPEQRVLRSELARDLESALQALPADQRLVVILSDIQGYSYDEIVAATGVPVGTVKSRLSRARARLREIINARNPDLHVEHQSRSMELVQPVER